MGDSELWCYLFEEEKLATKLKATADARDDGITIDSKLFGEIRVIAKSATGSGENFLSDAYIVQAIQTDAEIKHQAFVKGTQAKHLKDFLPKILPSAPMLFQGATTQGVYHRELAAYKTLHPMLRKMREESNVSPVEVPLAVSEMYHGHIDEHGPIRANSTAIVLEDLGLKGYRMTDKRIGVNVEEAMLTLTGLANYHALSIALVRQWRSPEGHLEVPKELNFLESNVAFQDKIFEMLGAVMPTYVDMFRKLNREKDADWLDDDFNNRAELALTPEKLTDVGPIICILHSDCWNNNLLYRYEEERPVDVRVIDWQIIRLGHPAFDVLQFLYSSSSAELRAVHLPALLERYYDTLEKALSLLGCPILKEHDYTRARFCEDFKKRLRFALYYSFIMLPTIHDTTLADIVDQGKSEDFAPDQELPDMFDADKYKDISSLDKILANKVLCQVLGAALNEIKVLLEIDIPLL